MKKEIRVLGIDDSPFQKHIKKDILIIGTVFRGGQFLDGLISTKIRVDGNNSTKNIIQMINKSKFKSQLKAIFLDGIAVGGFNIVDVKKLNTATKIPVIVIMRSYPNYKKILLALKKIGKEKKFKIIQKAGKAIKFNKVHFQYTGTTEKEAKEIIKLSTTHSFIPEPLRAAHLIATGIKFGESRGGA